MDDGLVLPERMMRISDINTEFNKPIWDYTTEAMIKHLRQGGTLPPIMVSENGYLHNGRHRLAAYMSLNYKEVPVITGHEGKELGKKVRNMSDEYEEGLKKYVRDNYAEIKACSPEEIRTRFGYTGQDIVLNELRKLRGLGGNNMDDYEKTINALEDEIMRHIINYEEFIQRIDCKTTKEDIANAIELIDMRLDRLIDSALYEMSYLDARHPTMDPVMISSRQSIRERIQIEHRKRVKLIRIALIEKTINNAISCRR